MSYQYPFIPGHSSMPATPQTTFRWDDGDPQRQQQPGQQHHQQERLEQQILQHPLQHQPEQRQDVYVPQATSTSAVQVQEHVPTVPSQNTRRPGSGPAVEGDEPRLQHLSVPPLLQPEHMRPPMIDTRFAFHVGTSASPTSGPSSAGPSSAYHGAIGPVRARISPVTASDSRAHPYRRPQSAAGVVIARSRREPVEDVQSVRPSRQNAIASSSRTSVPPMSAPATSSTAMVLKGWSSSAAAAKSMSTFKGLVNPAYSLAGGGNVAIRTDLHLDSETSVLTALCDLPGRAKSDVRVVLSTNAMNRVKQIVVTAQSPRVIGEDGCVLRERRSGSVSRTFVVPSGTTPDDVTVEMRDGLLTLKVQLPPLKDAEDDSQEIVIR